MRYISTRGGDESYSSAEAILQGMARNRGLLVPDQLPVVTANDLSNLADLSYPERAIDILSLFLTDYQADDLEACVYAAYRDDNFNGRIAGVDQLNAYNNKDYLLLLDSGPTAAFKDYALQLLPHLMQQAAMYTGQAREICILTATSGDTGKAALAGFAHVPGTRVMVFFPHDGVSTAQRLQMVTQEGDNCASIAVHGNFDDAQRGVRQIFADRSIEAELAAKGVMLSSANSINWGRLVPQIVYYFSAYADLLHQKKLEHGELINVVVPTGNFGNILAAWYAKQMGLPLNKLICASNRNKVLSDFIRTGKYAAQRKFYKTLSPSMDILVSSNLERLLFELSGRDAEQVVDWMEQLATNGSYDVGQTVLSALQHDFVGGFADDKKTLRTITDIYHETDYLVDTHTAVGFDVYNRYQMRSGDTTKTLFVQTASPFKFADSCADAIFGTGYSRGRSDEVLLKELSEETGQPIPSGIAEAFTKPILHDRVVPVDQMKDVVLGWF